MARLGITKIHLWDNDSVASHNLGNQIYRNKDIKRLKTDCLEEILKEINPDIQVVKHGLCTTETRANGYIFLCIDNIDVRRTLCEKWRWNPGLIYITDGRMRLTDGNIHSAFWYSATEKENIINSMQYTHEEAVKETPVSACGLTLSVICTPRVLASLMVSNFIKFINTEKYCRFIQVDSYKPFLEANEIN